MEIAINDVDISSELETLSRRISQGLCILFIGPGALRTKDGIPVNNAFALSLAAELRDLGIYFDPAASKNMPYMIQCYINGKNEKSGKKTLKIVDLREKYKKFMESAPIDYSLYETLASIPFSLVINTNYDDKFFQLFKSRQEKNKRKVEFDIYDFSNKNTVIGENKPKEDEPDRSLVYNLFGLCSEKTLNSMILTEAEFVRYIGKIHQPNTSIPLEITNFIDENKYCCFLGFDFDQWYLKVLVRALWSGTAHDGENNLSQPDTLALGLPSYNATTFFYQDTYKFSFINNDLNSFVKKLKKEFDTTLNFKPAIIKNNTKKEGPVKVVFIGDVNSPEDVSYRDEISKQLKHHVSTGTISLWAEDMSIGELATLKATEKIKEADILIALVSVDFINSNKIEIINDALEMDDEKPQKQLAVLLRPCVKDLLNPLKDFVWEPSNSKSPQLPLSQYSRSDQEAIITSIAENIYLTVKELTGYDTN